MGIMDTVQGGVGTGVQPQNNPSPVPGGPSAGAQTDINSLPPPAPPKASIHDPSADVDKFANEAFARMSPKDKAAADDKNAPPDPEAWAEDVFKGIGGAPAQKPEDTKFSDFISQEVQRFKAQFRQGVARNPTEALTGLQQVYGKDNVRVASDDVLVKPDGARNFRKFNEGEAAGWMKLFAATLGPAGLAFNMSQNPGGLAGAVPGMAIQGGAQALGTAAGFAGGAALTAPAGGVGGIPGAAAGGAAAGFGASKLTNAMYQRLNESLGQADPGFKYENKLSDLFDSTKAAQNNYIQAAAGAAGGLMSGASAYRAAGKAQLAMKGLTTPEIDAVLNSSDEEKALAKTASALREFHQAIVPSVETSDINAAGQKTLQGNNSVGARAVGAATQIMDDFGQKIGAVEKEASALQQKKGMFLQPTEFFKAAQAQLEKQEVKFLDAGQDGMANIDWKRTQLPPDAPAGTKDLMELYDHYMSTVDQSAVASSDEQPGLTIAQSKRLLDKLQSLKDTIGATNDKSAANPFGAMRKALTVDRATHMNALFQGEDSPAATMYQNSLKEYSSRKDAMDTVRDLFSTPEQQAAMAQKLSRPGSPGSVEAMNALRTVLGDDNPYWQNIRSDVIGRLISKGEVDGRFNPAVMKGFLNNPDNEPLLNTLFEGRTEDLNKLKLIMARGSDALQTATGSDNAQMVKGMAKGMVELASKNFPGSKLLKPLVAMTGGNRVALTETRQALLEGMNKAIGSDQRAAMMNSLNALDDFMGKSQVVDVPVTKGAKTFNIQKYIPMPQVMGQTVIPHAVPQPTEQTAPVPAAASPTQQPPGFDFNAWRQTRPAHTGTGGVRD